MAERIGDILLQCSGAAGTTVTGNLSLFLPVSVTNRVNADNVATDVSLVVENASAPLAMVAGRVTGQSISFNSVGFTMPPGGNVTLRISNLRANASQLGVANSLPVQVSISTTFAAILSGNPVTAARTARSLLATATPGGISCAGSPAPSEISMTALFSKGTRFASTRLTEAYAGAFQKKADADDTGTRFVVRYTGVPAGARIFVPDLIAGSSATQPTAAGDLGGTQAVGQYTPGSNGLFLSRVTGTDANGAGGSFVLRPDALTGGTLTLSTATELPVSGGTAMVVYEVLDSNTGLVESLQFPTFVAIDATTEAGIISETVSLGPVSTTPVASVNAPIPRFAAVDPAPDCTLLNDCESDLFPHLGGAGQGLQFTSLVGGAAAQPPGYITVRNEGGGMMSWNATVTYKNGSGWVTLSPSSGLNNRSMFVYIAPQTLSVGTYEATVTVDAGLAGSQSFPVKLTVSATPIIPVTPPAAPKVVISAITNGANFLFTPLAPGSIATIKGSNLKGASVAVTFDGASAKLLYVSAAQINLLVPAETAGKSSADVVVTVDGEKSAAERVRIAAISPAVFVDGVLNQDNSVNGPGKGAAPGSVLQIFATGLPASGVYVKIHDRDNMIPLYAGSSGFEGVQQVNARVPDDLPAMTTSLLVCAYGPDTKPVCSHPVDLVLVK